jgi:flagella basal body P-ring formation protein FlgA
MARRPGRKGRRALAGAALLMLSAARPDFAARAEDFVVPVPKIAIYPGDVIDDSMLASRSLPPNAALEHGVIESRGALIGKVARRTLLPGQPIYAIAVDNPRIVTLGARVKLVYSEGGLVITAFGVAQQAGGIGDFVQVRNLDSGLTVTGRVQRDGSVLVSEG